MSLTTCHLQAETDLFRADEARTRSSSSAIRCIMLVPHARRPERSPTDSPQSVRSLASVSFPRLTLFVDILSRLPSLFSDTLPTELSSRQARHLLKHIFPRQFGLHSAFTATQVAGVVPADDDDRELEIRVRWFLP